MSFDGGCFWVINPLRPSSKMTSDFRPAEVVSFSSLDWEDPPRRRGSGSEEFRAYLKRWRIAVRDPREKPGRTTTHREFVFIELISNFKSWGSQVRSGNEGKDQEWRRKKKKKKPLDNWSDRRIFRFQSGNLCKTKAVLRSRIFVRSLLCVKTMGPYEWEDEKHE